MMNCSMGNDFKIDSSSIMKTNAEGASFTYSSTTGGVGAVYSYYPSTGWDYFQNYYYPYVIRESYPVYLKEKSVDKGKQAFEILKALQDKKLLQVEKVSDFIEAMDSLIKIL